jgi:hypothetical protein
MLISHSNLLSCTWRIPATIAWMGYLVATGYLYSEIYELKGQGYESYLFDHYSNSVLGLGFIGTFHNSFCIMGATSCLDAYNKFKQSRSFALLKSLFHRSAPSQVRPKLSSHKLSLASYSLTAAFFTSANYYYELSGYFQDYNDFLDFFSGETGLFLYYYLAKLKKTIEP